MNDKIQNTNQQIVESKTTTGADNIESQGQGMSVFAKGLGGHKTITTVLIADVTPPLALEPNTQGKKRVFIKDYDAKIMREIKNEHMKQYPPRPTVSVDELASLVANNAHHAKKYGWADGDFAKNIAEAFFSTGHGDGYEIALRMSKEFFTDVSRDQMEDLDSVGIIYIALLAEKEKAWVLDNAIKPPFPIGTKVLYWDGFIGRNGVVDEIFLTERHVASYAINVVGFWEQPIIKFENVWLDTSPSTFSMCHSR